MSTIGQEHYSRGIDQMIAGHPLQLTEQGRYRAAVATMELVGFTPDELRGMLAVALEQRVAELEQQRERDLVAARRRTVLFALEAVAGDGFPRVCAYTTAHLLGEGLIERVPDDNLNRYQLTPEGRIVLHSNPAGAPQSDPDLFGSGIETAS